MSNREALGGFLVFFFGAVTAFLSFLMPIGTFRAAGPGLFPLSLGLLLMILSGMFILKIVFETAHDEGKERSGSKAEGAARRVVLVMGAIVSTVLVFQPLGYPFASFLLLLFLLHILGVKPWRQNVLISGATAIVSYLMFVRWLKIPLPKGWIGL